MEGICSVFRIDFVWLFDCVLDIVLVGLTRDCGHSWSMPLKRNTNGFQVHLRCVHSVIICLVHSMIYASFSH